MFSVSLISAFMVSPAAFFGSVFLFSSSYFKSGKFVCLACVVNGSGFEVNVEENGLVWFGLLSC